MHLPCFLPDWLLSLHDDEMHCALPKFVRELNEETAQLNPLLDFGSRFAGVLGVMMMLGMLWLRLRGISDFPGKAWAVPACAFALWIALGLLA